jgi:hypothetical protein
LVPVRRSVARRPLRPLDKKDNLFVDKKDILS